jgi:hypothetical protein
MPRAVEMEVVGSYVQIDNIASRWKGVLAFFALRSGPVLPLNNVEGL